MKAPKFSLPDQDGKVRSLDSFAGKTLVLYFYPKADTPGCTIEACGLRDNIGAIKALGAQVVGVSPDEPKDLKRFAEKFTLPFMLLGDPSTRTIQAYGVWGEKQFMGRRFQGVLRTTFLIDASGKIVKRYDKVNPATHADMILADLRAMRGDASASGTKRVAPKAAASKKRASSAKKRAPKRKTATKKRASAKKKRSRARK